jgi:hypothetical protein
MDKAKYEFFLAKYSAMDSDELKELASRGGHLIEEAQLALQAACSPNGISITLAPPEVTAKRPTTPEEIAEDKARSSALWNGPLSKRVEHLFVAQALVFSFAFLGPQGLKMGALPLLVLAATLSFIARKAGKSYTRRVCANAEASIDSKTSNLKTTGYILWPALLLSSLLGVMCATAIR